MTNKEYISSLPTEEFFSTIFWMMNDYRLIENISKRDVINWLDKRYDGNDDEIKFPWIREQNNPHNEEC